MPTDTRYIDMCGVVPNRAMLMLWREWGDRMNDINFDNLKLRYYTYLQRGKFTSKNVADIRRRANKCKKNSPLNLPFKLRIPTENIWSESFEAFERNSSKRVNGINRSHG
jgi:hypothetical protein